ncbi:MAG: hypothetical protein OEY03_00445 [Rhizobacter sp.]|nr:hypothetical protein [Rhizobacter sp.]
MGEGFGIEVPGPHSTMSRRPPARYLVIIGSGGVNIARLFMDSLEPAGEFDAATEEVTVLTRGHSPVQGATGPEWDKALQGHNAAERRAAKVFTIDL